MHVKQVSLFFLFAFGLAACGSFHSNFESAPPQSVIKGGGLSQVSWPGPYQAPTSPKPSQDDTSTTSAPVNSTSPTLPKSGAGSAAANPPTDASSQPTSQATPTTQAAPTSAAAPGTPVSATTTAVDVPDSPAPVRVATTTDVAPVATATSGGSEGSFDPTADPIVPEAAGGIQASDQKDVLVRSNKARAQAGLMPLVIDEKLSQVALAFAADMKTKNYFSHTSPDGKTERDRLESVHVSYHHAGENIAQGQQSAEEVLGDWMNSAGHRKNILTREFTKIGVGRVGDIWVQEFSD